MRTTGGPEGLPQSLTWSSAPSAAVTRGLGGSFVVAPPEAAGPPAGSPAAASGPRLKGGEAVRLLRGEMAEATVFDRDPAARAAAFAAEGAEWLHLVDLDGAFAGEARNAPAVEAILRAVRVPVQLGGGLRDRAGIERWLERGVARVVLGTAAVEDPGLVRGAARDLADLAALRAAGGIAGAIVGRALYEGAFSLREALG